jgi:histone acetyltransferase
VVGKLSISYSDSRTNGLIFIALLKRGPHYTQLLHLLSAMQNHQSAWPFLKPVNAEEVPDYYNLIMEPMDLETMRKRLEEDAYAAPDDFIRDAKLIFSNCRRYNKETTPYWQNANQLEEFMNQQLREIPEWSVSYLSPSIPIRRHMG